MFCPWEVKSSAKAKGRGDLGVAASSTRSQSSETGSRFLARGSHRGELPQDLGEAALIFPAAPGPLPVAPSACPPGRVPESLPHPAPRPARRPPGHTASAQGLASRSPPSPGLLNAGHQGIPGRPRKGCLRSQHSHPGSLAPGLAAAPPAAQRFPLPASVSSGLQRGSPDTAGDSKTSDAEPVPSGTPRQCGPARALACGWRRGKSGQRCRRGCGVSSWQVSGWRVGPRETRGGGLGAPIPGYRCAELAGKRPRRWGVEGGRAR